MLLHDESEGREDTSKDNRQAVAFTDLDSCLGSASGCWGRSTGSRSAAVSAVSTVSKSIVNNRVSARAASFRRCAAAGGRGGVDSVGILGAAWMVVGASCLAGIDTTASSDTLLAPFGTNVVGDGQAILRQIWSQSIGTNTVVCQIVL